MLAAAIALSAAIFLFCLIVACFTRPASKKDAVRRRLTDLSREVSRAYVLGDEELNKPISERFLKPAIQKMSRALRAILPNRRKGSAGDDKTRKMLQQAGWIMSVDEYKVIQLIVMVSCGLLMFVWAVFSHQTSAYMALYFLGGVYGGYAVLRYYCSSVGSRRKTAMEKQLPDMLDLLSVSVAAGLGFERAMLHIVETMEGPLIDEFTVTYREMSMGRSRKDALTLLGDRCGVEDLTAVTSALVQAGQLGIPIRNVLQSQSAAIRRSRRAKVQEKAAKVSTKILLPMVAFIFPVLLIVLLGPSLIVIMEQFG